MAVNLSEEDCRKLITGSGMWHTAEIEGTVPSVHLSDGPNGLRCQEESALSNNDSRVSTCFPTASAMGAGWDPDAARGMGHAIGEEARAQKAAVVLGPGICMKRSPLCGRNFEYFSEDPLLSGEMAAGFIEGVQAEGVGTSLKHFAGNSQETRRMTSNSQIDERALREIYLAAFEIAVKKAKPATVMASYNMLNGTYACENKELLTDILRNEWGFEGLVVSDWGACGDLGACIAAGMDLEMPGSGKNHVRQLQQGLECGKVTMEQIRTAAKRVAELALKYAPKGTDPRAEKEHDDVALKLALNNAVLLKNDNHILPLKKGSRISVIGDLAEHTRFQGGGSSHVHTKPVISARDALKEEGFDVRYAKGYDGESGRHDQKLQNEAVDLAKDSDLILFFGGLTDRAEGEGYDRKTLAIPSNQLSLLHRLAREKAKIVFVGFGGAPFEMPFLSKVDAMLHMYLDGQAAGKACAMLLAGEANPCGKLAETFPLSIRDVPCRKHFGGKTGDDIEYRESIFTGYRYYDTYHIPVLFPFGYGLSYTTFAYSSLHLSASSYEHGDLEVSFTITNTGDMAGAETAQVYVENPECDYLRPRQELRGFTKVFLQPHQSKTVSVHLNERSFSLYDVKEKKFVVPSGIYTVHVSAAVNDSKLSEAIDVKGVDYKRNDREELSEYFEKDLSHVSHEQFAKLYQKPFSHLDHMQKGEFSQKTSLAKLAKHSLLGKGVLAVATHTAYAMYKGRPHDDPELMMMKEGIRDGTVDSVACQSRGALPYGIVQAIVDEANGHIAKAWKEFLKGEKTHEYR